MSKVHCFRLIKGMDLRGAIFAYAKSNRLQAAVPVACVGCVTEWKLRGADGQIAVHGSERAEIVLLTGTVSEYGLHLHLSLAREDLSVFGGHLLEGCIINTTAEIVLMEMEGAVFRRVFDPKTGYDELDITYI